MNQERIFDIMDKPVFPVLIAGNSKIGVTLNVIKSTFDGAMATNRYENCLINIQTSMLTDFENQLLLHYSKEFGYEIIINEPLTTGIGNDRIMNFIIIMDPHGTIETSQDVLDYDNSEDPIQKVKEFCIDNGIKLIIHSATHFSGNIRDVIDKNFEARKITSKTSGKLANSLILTTDFGRGFPVSSISDIKIISAKKAIELY